MFVIAFDDHDIKKKNMDESKNPGWKLDSCLGGEWQRMAKGSRPHLECHAVSSWLELWQVPGIEELARNLDLKRINAGLSMPTHWSQSLTLCATMLSGPIYPPPSSMLEVSWETSSSATLPTGSELLKLEKKLKCRFGRRTAFFLLLFMATSLGVAIAFAPNYTVFTILRLVFQSFEGNNKWIDRTESLTYMHSNKIPNKTLT